MKQSRTTSLMKSLVSAATGFGISLVAQNLIMPRLLGAPVPIEANVRFAVIMTALSVARGCVLERCFEALSWRMRLSPFPLLVIAERRRRVELESESFDRANNTTKSRRWK
jgi:hypothetical protein